MEEIDVPVVWASTEGDTLPGVCARHGEPAEGIHDARFGHTSPGWTVVGAVTSLVLAFLLGVAVTPVLAVLPVLAFLVVVEKTRSRMEVAWPYCARCVSLHRRVDVFRRVAAALTLLGCFETVSRIRAHNVGGTTVSLMAGLVSMTLVALVMSWFFSWQRLARAQVSQDRLSVRVKAHPRFAAAVRDRLATERVAAGPTR